MLSSTSSIQLDGNLDLELDQHSIKVNCEGQSIELTFTSFTALRKFFMFSRHFNAAVHFEPIQHYINCLKISYYLNDTLIAESRPDLQKNWIGRYLGIERTKIYPLQFVSYLFKS